MKKTFLYSFKKSIPILISFIPVGLAYGILMQSAGYNCLWSGLTSMFVFAGSLQYLMVGFFTGSVSILSVVVMTLLLNSRFILCGFPFIEKWRKYGLWRVFLIFGIVDETFSLHITVDEKDGIDEKWAYIFNTLLVWLYWIALSTLGGVIGSFISFDTTGIDFALTALFIVITIEQIKGNTGSRLPAVIAAVSSIACLVVIGPDGFILPSLLITVVLLFVFRRSIEEVKE